MAQNVEQVAQMTEENARSIARVAATMCDMKAMATQLAELTGRFRLG